MRIRDMMLFTSALASPVWAQETTPAAPATPSSATGTTAPTDTGGSGGVEEIVVTAQKRAENLQKVPISISALSSAALEAKGITSISDFQRVPVVGLTTQFFAGNPQTLLLDLRGVTTPSPGQGTVEPGVAVYVDDVYVSRAQGAGTKLVDAERIEVLKGPQGTLFGRNAEGGAIRIVTKKPTGELGGDGKVTFGDYGLRQYEAHLNLPAVAGFAVKLDFLHDDLGGYTRNGGGRIVRLAQQGRYGAENTDGYRGSVRWKPVDGLTVDYAFDRIDSRVVNLYQQLSDPGALASGNPYYVQPATLRAPRPLDPGIHTYAADAWTGLYQGSYRDKTSAHTLNLAYALGNHATLKSITGYRRLYFSGSNNLDGAYTYTPQAAGTTVANFKPAFADQPIAIDPTTPVLAVSDNSPIVDYVRSKAWSQELQLVGSLPTLQYVLGGYYYTENVADKRASANNFFYTPAGVVASNPFLSNSTVGDGRTIIFADTRTLAAFAQATWSPAFAADRLHLTGGLRYTSDRKTFFRSQYLGNVATTAIGTVPLFGGGTTPLIPQTAGAPFRTHRVDPAATIAFDLTPRINAYVRYAQAYKAGGVGSSSPGLTPFGAEVNKAWEAGVKSELFDRRLRLNLALFENRIHNRQLIIQPNPQTAPNTTDTINTPGVTRVRGIEIDGVIAPTRNLSLSFSGSHTLWRIPDETLALNNGLAPAAQSVFYVQNTPRWAGSGGIDYSLPRFGFGGRLVFHIDYSLASKVYGSGRYSRTAFVYQVENHQGNLRLTLQDVPVGPTKLRIAGFVRNFANEIYPIYSSASTNYINNTPRLIGVEIGASF